MNLRTLFTAIGHVDDAMLADACAAADKKRRRFSPALALVPVAACAAILAAVLLQNPPALPAPPSDSTAPHSTSTGGQAALPTFSLAESTTGGYGMESVLVKEPGELLYTGWPIAAEDAPDTLPVFVNARSKDLMGRRSCTPEELEAAARDTAARLGLTVEEVTFLPTEEDIQAIYKKFEDAGLLPTEEDDPDTRAAKQEELDWNTAIYQAIARCTDGTVIRSGWRIQIELPQLLDVSPLPTPQEKLRLAEHYGPLLGIAQPRLSVFTDYSYAGEPLAHTAFWDAAAPLPRQLLFASCGELTFVNESHSTIYYSPLAAGDALGEYPVITVEEAKALLRRNQCLTSVPDSITNDSEIGAVELVYREGSDVYAPWYRFWVKLPEGDMITPEGLLRYGAYYVPAVHSDYVQDMPHAQWDYTIPQDPTKIPVDQ